jgi:hypothetical protein
MRLGAHKVARFIIYSKRRILGLLGSFGNFCHFGVALPLLTKYYYRKRNDDFSPSSSRGVFYEFDLSMHHFGSTCTNHFF